MNENMSDRDKLIIDMYADVRAMKESVSNIEKTVGEHSGSISNIEKDIHAVKVSARLIKAAAALIGAVSAILANWISKLFGT